jgi:hypothetical protein
LYTPPVKPPELTAPNTVTSNPQGGKAIKVWSVRRAKS